MSPRVQGDIDKLLEQVSAEAIAQTITDLSHLNTRYYTTETGVEGAARERQSAVSSPIPWHTDTWPLRLLPAGAKVLHSKYSEIAADSPHASVRFFPHSWPQPSVIARIEGTGNVAPLEGDGMTID